MRRLLVPSERTIIGPHPAWGMPRLAFGQQETTAAQQRPSRTNLCFGLYQKPFAVLLCPSFPHDRPGANERSPKAAEGSSKKDRKQADASHLGILEGTRSLGMHLPWFFPIQDRSPSCRSVPVPKLHRPRPTQQDALSLSALLHGPRSFQFQPTHIFFFFYFFI